MADVSAKTFHCQLISPEQTVLDCQASFVAMTAHDGQIGIATNRAPLLCKLGIGPMRVDADDSSQRFCVEGGYAQMRENKLVVLTPSAIHASAIDAEQARQMLAEADALPLADPARVDQLARAKTQLALAQDR